MDKILYKGITYDIIATINFSGSEHLIIKKDADVIYINKNDNRYFLPPSNLSLEANSDIPLPYLRKQFLLRYLLQFINEREISEVTTIKKIIKAFKQNIKNSNIERFLYWPLLSQQEFESDLKCILKDLEFELEQVLEPNIIRDETKKDTIDFNYKSINI